MNLSKTSSSYIVASLGRVAAGGASQPLQEAPRPWGVSLGSVLGVRREATVKITQDCSMSVQNPATTPWLVLLPSWFSFFSCRGLGPHCIVGVPRLFLRDKLPDKALLCSALRCLSRQSSNEGRPFSLPRCSGLGHLSIQFLVEQCFIRETVQQLC